MKIWSGTGVKLAITTLEGNEPKEIKRGQIPYAKLVRELSMWCFSYMPRSGRQGMGWCFNY